MTPRKHEAIEASIRDRVSILQQRRNIAMVSPMRGVYLAVSAIQVMVLVSAIVLCLFANSQQTPN